MIHRPIEDIERDLSAAYGIDRERLQAELQDAKVRTDRYYGSATAEFEIANGDKDVS